MPKRSRKSSLLCSLSNSLTIFVFPSAAAYINAVLPLLSITLTSAPFSISISVNSKFPFEDAIIKGVSLFWFGLLTDIPPSISNSAVSKWLYLRAIIRALAPCLSTALISAPENNKLFKIPFLPYFAARSKGDI